ncbi:serine/threonine-protein kinase STY17-like isoform X1 [Salvia miltiorrhiza]|uniref:serine/threonine-protein kinase STY17-like isoform X1 n=1 Tax=Salvia miltiorrhiza TaxID=226208 RepID=UPI0025ACEAE3|nr:serine/threonine-protein kinase STY17-like isoform X1 [Salvia miltiorrhiza]
MEKSSDGFVRADQIDLKSLDEQLERHLNRAWTMEKNKRKNQEDYSTATTTSAAVAPATTTTASRRQRQEWEIDPSKLIIKSVIARGTFGTVHRGVYDGQDVAVKLLDWGEEGHRTEAEIQALRAAFTQEVVVWHKLDHPNVTKFIGATMGATDLNIQTENGHIGMPSNICCVVVEYLPGGALKSYLIKNRRKKLAFKVVVQMALDLARGLSYLHSQKIVHRDVKTENMLLDKTRTVKIADFGVARVEASNPNDMTGETGTLGYMAPEVLFYCLVVIFSVIYLVNHLLVHLLFWCNDHFTLSLLSVMIKLRSSLKDNELRGFYIICRFSMEILTTGNATCTVLGFVYGRYIVAICHIPILVSRRLPQQSFARYISAFQELVLHSCYPKHVFSTELATGDTQMLS